MDKTNEIEVKENKFIKWFKKVFKNFGIGKKQKLLEEANEDKFQENKEPPTTAYKKEDKRNEFVEGLREQAEKEPETKEKEEKKEETAVKVNVPSKDGELTDEYFIHSIIQEYNRENGRAITEKDLEYLEIHPGYYIKNDEGYLLDYKDKSMTNYTRNASTAFAMVDKNENKVITAVGVVDGRANYIRGNYVKVNNKEYKGAGMQIDFRNLGFKEKPSDPHKKYINELAYFAFSKQLDKQILQEKTKTKEKDTTTTRDK